MKKIVKCLIWMVLMLSLSLVISCSEVSSTNTTVNTVPNTTSQEDNLNSNQGSLGEASSLGSNVVSGTQTQPQASSSSLTTIIQPTTSVNSTKEVYTLSITQGVGGSISSNKLSATEGEEIVLTNVVEEGYTFIAYSVKQGTTSVSVTNGKFTMPNGNVTITATFVKNVYTISVTQPVGGTVSVNKTTASFGEEIVLTNNPSAGYAFVAYSVKQGTTSVSVTNGKFTMPNGDVTITATFVKNTYTITITQPTGGTIAANKASARVGEEVTLSNSAATGYTFTSYVVKQGGTEIAVTNGKFTMPNGNVTITATFTINQYTVTITQPTGGSITVKNGSTTISSGAKVNHGTTLTLSNSASTGYTFGKYKVNGSETTATSHTVTGNITISGTFTINQYTVTITQPTGGSITVKNGSTTISSGTKVNYGTTLTLSNSASTGYTFTNYKIGSATQTTTSYKVTGNITISATFTINQYTVTITQPTGGSITVKNGSTTISSGTKVNYGTTLTLSNSASTGYTFTNYKIGSATQTTTSYKVTGNVTISGTFTIKTYTVTVTQPTGGSIKANSKTGSFSVNHGTKITLSNTASAGYVFSSYKVNSTTQTSTSYTVTSVTTVTGTFNKGIGGLSAVTFSRSAHVGKTSGSMTISSGKVTSTENGYPYVFTGTANDFYFETTVKLTSDKIYNSDAYPKFGIALQVGEEYIYYFVDAIATGYNNKGFGTNTWVIAARGRGSLLETGSSTYFADHADRKAMFSGSYTSIHMAVLKVGEVYKFMVNNKHAFSLWLPSMSGDSVYVGLYTYNLGYEATNIRMGEGTTVVNNANAYYGLTSSKNPTSVTVDGNIADWKENAKQSYGANDGTRYFYATAFKSSNGVYVAYQARTKNYITNSTSGWWTNTNVELHNQASKTVHASANGDNDGFTSYKFNAYQESSGGYYIVTFEGLLPFSLWGGTDINTNAKLGFAFRSEEVGNCMDRIFDSAWWTGPCHYTIQGYTVNTSGINTGRTVPVEDTIKTNVKYIGDPYILADTKTNKYYMYCTSGVNTGYYVWTSTDLVTWGNKTLALDIKTAGTFGHTDYWAPEVVYNASTGKYVMFYSARNTALGSSIDTYWDAKYGNYNEARDRGVLKIGVAVATSPLGPFKAAYSGPMFDTHPLDACIDGSCFVDDNGKAYLYYSRDCSQNMVNGVHTSQTMVVQLDSTYTKTVGTHYCITTPDQHWETDIDTTSSSKWNEGPYVFKAHGKYFLTYSANWYNSPYYGIGCAISHDPLGQSDPFNKYSNPIVFKEDGLLYGPGHNMFFTDFQGRLWCCYHSKLDSSTKDNRQLTLSRAYFDCGVLKVSYKHNTPPLEG